VTVRTPGDARPQPTGLRRWLLGTLTLVLAVGVVVMHALGVGHHGAAVGAPTGAAASHATGGHASGDHDPGGPASVDLASTAPVAPTAHMSSAEHGPAAVVADVAVTVRVAVAGAGHGAMVMCLAVLPLLLLLRRPAERAWFRRAPSSVRRRLAGLSASWLSRPPGRAGPSLAELCILRT